MVPCVPQFKPIQHPKGELCMKRAYLGFFTTIALIASLSSVAEETATVEPTPDVNNCRVTFLPETGELFLPCVDVLSTDGQIGSYRAVLNSQYSTYFELSHYEQLPSNQSNLRANSTIIKWLYNNKTKVWFYGNVAWEGGKWVVTSVWDSIKRTWSYSKTSPGIGCTLTSQGSTVTGLGCK